MYKQVINYSKEEKCWVVVVPELAGCQADGDTMQEALANADTIIQEWLETANSLGRKIPESQGSVR